MAVVLDKPLALKTACIARQAERSVAFGLLSDSEWSLMRDYYNEDRQRMVFDTIDNLEGLISKSNQHISRDSVFPCNLRTVLKYPLTRLLNCFRSRWRFNSREIQFMTNTLRTFAADLQIADKPDPQHLVELRMSLLTSHEIIGWRMAGVPEFDKAMCVEHFNQAYHLPSFTVEEICGASVLVST